MGQDSSHVVAACGKASLKDSFVMFCFHRRSRSTRHLDKSMACGDSGHLFRNWRQTWRSVIDIGDTFRMSGSTAEWNKKGAALSDKSARKEFGLTQEQIIDAINSGKFQYRQNHIHGNPYFRLLRAEVESLAKELIGIEKLKYTQCQNELSQVNREINKLKKQLNVLENKKTELSSQIIEKDFS